MTYRFKHELKRGSCKAIGLRHAAEAGLSNDEAFMEGNPVMDILPCVVCYCVPPFCNRSCVSCNRR